MKYHYLLRLISLIFLVNIHSSSFGQKRISNEQIGLSIPVIWNNTKIFNVYSGARAIYISGKAVSYGININYSKDVLEHMFITAGIGYFNQNFGIRRPFDFNGDSTKFGYVTKKYSYNNINWILGIGYNLALNKNYALHGSLLFHGLYTFRQIYIPTSLTNLAFKKYQVENESFPFGQMLDLNVGAYKNISQRLSVGIDLVLPLHTKWRKDKIFREDEDEYYHSKLSIGTNLSVKYNLHH